MVNVIAGLIAYTYQEKKPSLNLTTEDLNLLQEEHLFPSEPNGTYYYLNNFKNSSLLLSDRSILIE